MIGYAIAPPPLPTDGTMFQTVPVPGPELERLRRELAEARAEIERLTNALGPGQAYNQQKIREIF